MVSLKNFAFLGLVTVILSASSAFAADDTEIKFTGDFRLRYENYQNPTAVYRASDSEAHVNDRFRLSALLRKGENVTAGLTLIHAAEWGSHSGVADSALSSTGTGDSSDGTKDGIADTQNMILVNRAWASWRTSNSVNFQFGRIGMVLGDGTVMSENDWQQIPTSQDGIVANWEVNFGKFEVFAIKTNEYGPGFITHDAERNLYGLSVDMRTLPDWVKLLHAHFIQVVKDETGTGNDSSPPYLAGAKINEQRLGISLAGDKNRFFYRLSGDYVFGSGTTNAGATQNSLDISEYMLDTSLGFAWNTSQTLKTSVGFHIDSGSKNISSGQAQGYESFYYDIHAYGGFMDVIRWGNLTSLSFTTTYDPTEDIELGLNYFYFAHSVKSDENAPVGTTASPTQFGPEYKSLVASPSATELGHELDLSLKKSFDSGIKLLGVASAFAPGSAIKTATDPKQDRLIFEYFAQASIDF